jgi:2-polyprenyl-6-methoxyphenol hydroxylase-like FAD-dependent oxidoreductase
LLTRGVLVLEELLPGFRDDLLAQGAVGGDLLGNVRWYVQRRMLKQVRAGLPALSASRPLIEGEIRRRVLAMPNIVVEDRTDIAGFVTTADGRRVTGARIRRAGRQADEVIAADLVVDATGRGSRLPRWLAGLGHRIAPEDRVTVHLAYASRVFRMVPEVLGTDMVAVIARTPDLNRGAVVQRLEGNRCLVTLTGILGEEPPLEHAGFLDYAESLASAEAFAVARTAIPLTDAVRFRFPAYFRRRYEKLAGLPAGLFVVGDALCSFNPVYGQGMSIAAVEALRLRDELERPDGPRPERYFRAVAEELEAPWQTAVGADLPTITQRPPDGLGQYLLRLQRAAHADPVVSTAFVRVTGLVEPPSTLLDPDLALRVWSAPASRAA